MIKLSVAMHDVTDDESVWQALSEALSFGDEVLRRVWIALITAIKRGRADDAAKLARALAVLYELIEDHEQNHEGERG